MKNQEPKPDLPKEKSLNLSFNHGSHETDKIKRSLLNIADKELGYHEHGMLFKDIRSRVNTQSTAEFGEIIKNICGDTKISCTDNGIVKDDSVDKHHKWKESPLFPGGNGVIMIRCLPKLRKVYATLLKYDKYNPELTKNMRRDLTLTIIEFLNGTGCYANLETTISKFAIDDLKSLLQNGMTIDYVSRAEGSLTHYHDNNQHDNNRLIKINKDIYTTKITDKDKQKLSDKMFDASKIYEMASLDDTNSIVEKLKPLIVDSLKPQKYSDDVIHKFAVDMYDTFSLRQCDAKTAIYHAAQKNKIDVSKEGYEMLLYLCYELMAPRQKQVHNKLDSHLRTLKSQAAFNKIKSHDLRDVILEHFGRIIDKMDNMDNNIDRENYKEEFYKQAKNCINTAKQDAKSKKDTCVSKVFHLNSTEITNHARATKENKRQAISNLIRGAVYNQSDPTNYVYHENDLIQMYGNFLDNDVVTVDTELLHDKILSFASQAVGREPISAVFSETEPGIKDTYNTETKCLISQYCDKYKAYEAAIKEGQKEMEAPNIEDCITEVTEEDRAAIKGLIKDKQYAYDQYQKGHVQFTLIDKKKEEERTSNEKNLHTKLIKYREKPIANNIFTINDDDHIESNKKESFQLILNNYAPKYKEAYDKHQEYLAAVTKPNITNVYTGNDEAIREELSEYINGYEKYIDRKNKARLKRLELLRYLEDKGLLRAPSANSDTFEVDGQKFHHRYIPTEKFLKFILAPQLLLTSERDDIAGDLMAKDLSKTFGIPKLLGNPKFDINIKTMVSELNALNKHELSYKQFMLLILGGIVCGGGIAVPVIPLGSYIDDLNQIMDKQTALANEPSPFEMLNARKAEMLNAEKAATTQNIDIIIGVIVACVVALTILIIVTTILKTRNNKIEDDRNFIFDNHQSATQDTIKEINEAYKRIRRRYQKYYGQELGEHNVAIIADIVRDALKKPKDDTNIPIKTNIFDKIFDNLSKKNDKNDEVGILNKNNNGLGIESDEQGSASGQGENNESDIGKNNNVSEIKSDEQGSASGQGENNELNTIINDDNDGVDGGVFANGGVPQIPKMNINNLYDNVPSTNVPNTQPEKAEQCRMEGNAIQPSSWYCDRC